MKTYPFAITRTAGKRRMENWANSRIAVIKSQKSIETTKTSTKPGKGRGLLSERPKMMKKAAIIPSANNRARRCCAGPDVKPRGKEN
jgi:hypothetical protein